MRGNDEQQLDVFSYVSPEQRVPHDHPLRPLRVMTDEALRELQPRLHKLYAKTGRPSIAPEKLLRALLLQAPYSVRSERLLMEQLDYNLLFRWFVGLNMDDAIWDVTVFTKNRERLLDGDIAEAFFQAVLQQARERSLLSDEHFTVDGTLLEAWASVKSYQRKDVRHQVSRTYEGKFGKEVTSAEHRAGWDATFSAPKSVSLTALVGGDDRVREAHRESVRAALRELERYTQARIGNVHAPETTGKFIAATFEHDTARPVDSYAAPQLHTHAVIFNMTERENGFENGKQMRALQPHEMFVSQRYATAVYRSELALRLGKLGYDLERGKHGQPEVRGYTKKYLEASRVALSQSVSIPQFNRAVAALAGAGVRWQGEDKTR